MNRYFLRGFTLLILMVASTFSQALTTRTLLKKDMWFALSDGTVVGAEYWALHMGSNSFEVRRSFPGEGVVDVSGSANFSLVSSGYIDGAGFASGRGRVTVKADFAVKDGGEIRVVELDDIDYIYFGGSLIKRFGADAEEDLYLRVERDSHLVQPRGLTLAVYAPEGPARELRHQADYERVIAVSFTRDGARRGYEAALSAND